MSESIDEPVSIAEMRSTCPWVPGIADEDCPVRDLLNRLGDAWTLLVVLALGERVLRFGELRRALDGVSKRMLSVTLRNLERDGLVSRRVIPTNPPQVEYSLTEMGHSLAPPIQALTTWATSHHNHVKAARDAYDAAESLPGGQREREPSGLGRAMPLNRGPVDLEELCREVIDSCRATHPARVVRLHSDGDVNGHWDASRIRQVVSNLVGNTIQHGSPEGPIDLSVTSEGSSVVLSVHNEGAPIPPDVLPTIFDPLVRYATRESTARRKPGSIGLGLYIVREIVVAKGGTVKVTSTLEEGTTFTIRIPRFLPVEGTNGDDAKAVR